jgi:ribonuclease R
MTRSKSKKGRFKLSDPHAKREAGKYENPIPSRELILDFLKDYGAPLTREEIARKLDLSSVEDSVALSRRLSAMERDGQLLRNRKNRFCIINREDLIAGRVLAHSDGFGFLRPEEDGDDLFLSPKQMRSLLHGDRVVVNVAGIDRRGRREGAVVEILERHNHRIVGRLQREGGMMIVIPDSKNIHQDILIPDRHCGEALEGQIVVAEILEQPNRRRPPVGRVIEVLGDHLAPGMEIEMAIRSHELPYLWPDEVLEESEKIGEEVSEASKKGRVDLRDLPLVTIDGEDARDFDDAVYCKKTKNGWKLLVAIADVSHYVKVGSPLDIEAKARGNSVYFPSNVIPMLPESLSNGLCSLNPNVDRLCMVGELYIDHEGKVFRSRFFEAVIRSHARLTYDEVSEILEQKNKVLRGRREELLPHLEALYELYKVLHAEREKRGAMDFDTTESTIVFGKDRKIENIIAIERNDAHRLIEECMITANRAAARFLKRKKIDSLQRVHGGPSESKLLNVRTFLGELGLKLEGGDSPEPSDYMKVINETKERPDRHLIQTVLLRSFSQAVYSPELSGHFGLALDEYAHFTSPIRRYPDLLVHRAIRYALTEKEPALFNYSYADMKQMGEHCSETERRADEATRDVSSWLKCEYMQDRLGESFDATITAVTSFGFFAELNDIYVEGLVHVSSLGRDYYHFDPVSHSLKGERTGQGYRLGDAVRVVVTRVDLDERKIDLALDEAKSKDEKKRAKKKKKSGKVKEKRSGKRRN